MPDTTNRMGDNGGRLFAEDVPNRNFELFPEGDTAAFHTQNNPDDPYQRDDIIERRGRVYVSCEHKDIVHGYHSDEVDHPYTLVVLGFRFDPCELTGRIKEAHITVRFAAMDREGSDPEVVAMYPDGNFTMNPTTQNETKTMGGGLTLGGGAVGAGWEMKAEVTRDLQIPHATRIQGFVHKQMDRNWGHKNCVSWNLWENKSTKTGVVSSLQAGILLKRRNPYHFKSTVEIKIVGDILTTLGSIFKKDPLDDDVWYNPDRQPPSTDRLRVYDVKNLGTFESSQNMKSVSHVTFSALLPDSVDEE